MNICNGCGYSDNTKGNWVISDGKKYHKGCIERLLACKHQHTVIDSEAIKKDGKRFLICVDCEEANHENHRGKMK